MERKQYPSNLERYKQTQMVEYIDRDDVKYPPLRWVYYDIKNGVHNPHNVLLTYLVHPDESDAQKAIMTAMEKRCAQPGMPNILFVPVSSPTGQARHLERRGQSDCKKNTNGAGNNLNWSFLDGSTDPEVLSWISLLKGKQFDYSLHIHHDDEMFGKNIYGYLHEKEETPPPIYWESFTQSITHIGYTTYSNQYDDQENPALGNWIPQNGLIVTSPHPRFNGSFENYIVGERIARSALTIELPTHLKEKEYVPIVNAVYGLINRKSGFVR